MPDAPLIAAIEAGGTKFIVSLASGPGRILVRERIPTTTPQETLANVISFLREAIAQHGTPAAIGVASFGPIDVTRVDSPTYGFITSTPKAGWQNVDLLGALTKEFRLPGFMDTDVNGAALSEWKWGTGQGLTDVTYLTIGTGIGGGAVVNGRPIHGLLHPEIGHIRIPRPAEEIAVFAGNCPFHGDCLEGLASGPAIAKRWGVPAGELPEDHPAWDLEAEYLAAGLVNLILTLSPQRIVMGGGVMDQRGLFPKIQARVQALLNGYVVHPSVQKEIARYIVPPGLGNDAGLLGAVALAQEGLARG